MKNTTKTNIMWCTGRIYRSLLLSAMYNFLPFFTPPFLRVCIIIWRGFARLHPPPPFMSPLPRRWDIALLFSWYSVLVQASSVVPAAAGGLLFIVGVTPHLSRLPFHLLLYYNNYLAASWALSMFRLSCVRVCGQHVHSADWIPTGYFKEKSERT